MVLPLLRISAFSVLLIIVAAGWLGMLVGVSFLATPAKFLAPSLTLPVALDVGRHTFAVYNKIEWGFCIALLLVVFLGSRGWISGVFTSVAMLIVALETLWLLPLLDARVGVIIAGDELAPSNHHTLYIALEAAKMMAIALVLVAVSWRVLRRPN